MQQKNYLLAAIIQKDIAVTRDMNFLFQAFLNHLKIFNHLSNSTYNILSFNIDVDKNFCTFNLKTQETSTLDRQGKTIQGECLYDESTTNNILNVISKTITVHLDGDLTKFKTFTAIDQFNIIINYLINTNQLYCQSLQKNLPIFLCICCMDWKLNKEYKNEVHENIYKISRKAGELILP